ncbi:SIMPL domain-containing protein [Luteirhabdus pelagi]|uniref:SIMPL domain-containing protein n=1 Tax=Luteirhabdus pelagi TaxID=2792783 RepID=UPI001939AAE0|nr:SIMPL domain-containing protein [Luteirhabdus pelagi]
MRKLITTCLILKCIIGFSQDNKEPILQVLGSAKVIIKPDLAVLNINASEIEETMALAVQELGDKSDFYTNLLKKLDFKQNDLKTTQFSVSKNRVYQNNRYVDSGYVASQKIRLEFKYKKETLKRILTELSNSQEEIDFSFDFKLSDELKSDVQDKILEYAVADSKKKAEKIASSADVKILRISKITYGGWGSGDGGMQQVERENRYPIAMASSADNTVFNFTPDDLLFRDTITVEWLIE